MILLFVFINITAALLETVTAQNPMALETEFKIPLVMFVFVGVIVVDSFYAVSAMLSFYLVFKLYES